MTQEEEINRRNQMSSFCTIFLVCKLFLSSLPCTVSVHSVFEFVPHSPPSSTSHSPASSPPCTLLCFGEISAGNCESFTSCSHNGLWDYAKHSASAALPIDQHQRRPLELAGKRWSALNEDVTAITQARFTDTLCVCSSSSNTPFSIFKTFFQQSFEVQPHLAALS